MYSPEMEEEEATAVLASMSLESATRDRMDSGFASPRNNRVRTSEQESFVPAPTIITDILLDYVLIMDEQLPQGLRLARRKADSKVFALKILPNTQQAQDELGVWQACLPHPNIVPLEAIYENQFRPGHPLLSVYLDARPHAIVPPGHKFLVAVMPRMTCDLLDHLCSPHTQLSTEEIKELLRQLLAALGHVHKQGYVHADVKLENILLESLAPLRIRLCDFGFARLAVVLPAFRQYTMSYLAPETIFSYEHALKHQVYLPLGTSIDIWAFGVAAFIIFAKREPFPLRDSELRLRMSAASPFPPNFRARVITADYHAEALRDAIPLPKDLAFFETFLSRALAVDPDARGSAAHLLCDAFLRVA
eukprot:m.7669 g.7669  ORF g.7669 m.7669 type:complete len:363 (+) comp5075_c0_seq1:91-1179(+)